MRFWRSDLFTSILFLPHLLVLRGEGGSFVPGVLAPRAPEKHWSLTGHLFLFASCNVSSEEQGVKMSEHGWPKAGGSFLCPLSTGLNVAGAAAPQPGRALPTGISSPLAGARDALSRPLPVGPRFPNPLADRHSWIHFLTSVSLSSRGCFSYLPEDLLLCLHSTLVF